MRVENVSISTVKEHGHKGYCPNCGSLINQKSSMFICFHCEKPIEWTRTQELAEEIRKEVSQLCWDMTKVNELLDDIILETRNIETE